MKPRIILLLLAANALFGFAVLAPGQQLVTKPPQATEQLPSPVVSDGELMVMFYKPLYQRLKAGMAVQPIEAKSWRNLRQYGNEVAELANLLAIRDKHGDLDDLTAQWPSLSQESRKAGIALAAAAKANDWPETQAAYQAVIYNCNACHQAYRKNQTKNQPFYVGSGAPNLEP